MFHHSDFTIIDHVVNDIVVVDDCVSFDPFRISQHFSVCI